jgi:uncharacterized protein (TIGR02246 family)
MKKTIRLSLLLAFVSIAITNSITAQDATKELRGFTKQFEQGYNQKNSKALKDMFTKDAVRTGADGKIYNGNEAIAAMYEVTFQDDVAVTIKLDKAVTESDGSTKATGSYHVTGTSKSGEKIDRKGSYVQTLVKEEGQWKIAKQVLTAL